jgi:hypothetical protein
VECGLTYPQRYRSETYNNPASIVGPEIVLGSNLREFSLPGIAGAVSKIQFVELNGNVIIIIAK